MKLHNIILSAAGALLGLAACSKDEMNAPEQPQNKAAETLVPVTLGASFADTKTAMDDATGNVIWLEGDQISVQVGSNNYIFTLESGANTNSGTFSALVTESDAKIIAGTDAGTVSACYPTSGASVPTSQAWAEGTFADETFPMTATKTSGSTLEFTTNAAVVRVQNVSATATSATLSYTVSSTEYHVSMALTAGDTAKDLYFVIIPGAQTFNLALNGGTVVEYSATAVTEKSKRYNLTASGVAKIGDKTYPTLAEAFDKAEDGQTIELLQNCSLAASTTVDKNVTLDLKSLTLTSTVSGDYLFKVASGKSFTLTNGFVADGTEGAATGLIQPTAATVVISDVNFGTFNTAGTTNILFPMTGSTSLTLTDVTVTTNNNVVKTSGESNALVVTNGTYTDTKRNDGTHTFDLLNYDTSSALFDGVTISSPDAAERQSCIEASATKGTSNIILKNCEITAAFGNAVYIGADMTIINCTVTASGSSTKEQHALSVETEHTVNVYGGTYKTTSYGAALKIWTSGGTFKVYDKYNSETLPVVLEGPYVFYIDSNDAEEEKSGIHHTAEVYFEGDNIQTKGQWAQQHIATAYVKGGYHDCTVWYGSNANTFILSGGTYTMDPRTNSCFKIADGYTVQALGTDPETWQVVELPPNVTNVTQNKGYSTLKDACDEAVTGDVLRLNNDFSEENPVNIKDKSITIDLNSHTITMVGQDTYTQTQAFSLLHGSGTAAKSELIIDDFSNEKSGIINCTAPKFINFGSNDAGTAFTMNHGEIICNGSSDCTTLYCYYTGCNVTINGGKITNEKANSSGKPLLYLKSGTTATINGGELVATGSDFCEVVNIAGGTLNITGGTLKSISPGSYSYCINGGSYSGTINISGGTISAFSDSDRAYTIKSGSNNIINITGGELSADVNSASERKTIMNIESASSSSSITGGTFKVGRTGSSYYGYKYDDSFKNYIPSTHQLNGPTTSEESTLGEYTVTAK